MAISINFKVSGSGGTTFALELEPSTTVQELKSLASKQCSIEAEQMKVIFKGRILKDTDVLESLQAAPGSSMHIVKSAPSASVAKEAAVTAPTSTAGATASDAPSPAAAFQPFPAAGAGATPAGGMPDLSAMMSDPAMMQMMGAMGGPGGMGAMGGGSPGADPFGAGLGGMPGMDMDPAMMSQMLQNPMMQQMMQNLASNPQMMQTIIQNNPMLQNMAQQNPMLQSMLSNPQMLQAMMNPQMLQLVAQMRQMRQPMPGLGAPGAMSQTPTATNTPTLGNDTTASPGGALPGPMFDPAMMQAMQTMMGGGMGGGPGLGGLPTAADAVPPEQRFATQLDQLTNMGFPDKHSNLQALQTANGDVNQAINSLLGA